MASTPDFSLAARLASRSLQILFLRRRVQEGEGGGGESNVKGAGVACPLLVIKTLIDLAFLYCHSSHFLIVCVCFYRIVSSERPEKV